MVSEESSVIVFIFLSQSFLVLVISLQAYFWCKNDNWKKGWDIAYTKWKTLGAKSIKLKVAQNEEHYFLSHNIPWQTAMLIETDKYLVKHGFLMGELTLTMDKGSDKFTYVT